MKARLIVAVIGIPVLFLAILFLPSWVLGIIAGGAAACCAWEFLRCTEEKAPPRVPAYAAVSAFCIPFLSAFYDRERVLTTVLFLLFAVMFIELLLSFRRPTTMEFETVAVTLLAGGVIPMLLAGVVRLRLRENAGVAYALLPFIIAFLSDAAAFFVGITLGKHKLTPRLSPNKTLEGSIGGFAFCILLVLVYGLVLKLMDYQINFAVLGVYGFFGSLAAQVGDLSFSAVKRLYQIKDYGKLLPGHGGMLDRLDSIIWVVPVLELLVAWVPAFYAP
ncbi:MAG: phosphatidate cytidylyltransferase [Oscillospiraceae bacterium]|nr:phosphatidate cytidylyltransferase [Oscillospiraceae bacterium]